MESAIPQPKQTSREMVYFQMAAQKGGARFETADRCGEEIGRILLIKTKVFAATFEKSLKKIGRSALKYSRTDSISSWKWRTNAYVREAATIWDILILESLVDGEKDRCPRIWKPRMYEARTGPSSRFGERHTKNIELVMKTIGAKTVSWWVPPPKMWAIAIPRFINEERVTPLTIRVVRIR